MRAVMIMPVLAAALALGGCDPKALYATEYFHSYTVPLTDVLTDPARPEADRTRDESRKLVETLAFARMGRNLNVTDMIMGGGYFTRAFASTVGLGGRVTAWQPAEFISFSADYATAITEADQIANVDAIRSPIGAPEFPGRSDLVFTAQNYHDLHMSIFPADTAARVNAAVFSALKPGGLYVVIDHHAAPGSGLNAVDDLHRIDVETVKAEVLAAGFVLDGESGVLANTTDPLTANVYDASIRGRTSQFMLRFRKP